MSATPHILQKRYLCFIDFTQEELTQLSQSLQYAVEMGNTRNILNFQWVQSFDPTMADALCVAAHFPGFEQKEVRPVVCVHHCSNALQPVIASYPLRVIPLLDALESLEKILELSDKEDILFIEPPISTDHYQSGQPFFATTLINESSRLPNRSGWRYADGCIWLEDKNLYSTCTTLPELLVLLQEPSMPEKIDTPRPENLSRYLYDAVVWSFGLHTPLNAKELDEYQTDGRRYHLKKWPLFGPWEKNSQLLLLTTLFSQKPTSVHEATVRSNLPVDNICRFLTAVRYCALPMTVSDGQSDAEQVFSERKHVGWVDALRDKLSMQESLNQ